MPNRACYKWDIKSIEIDFYSQLNETKLKWILKANISDFY